jgi:two-component system chemotaxis sensor kinase CheA
MSIDLNQFHQAFFEESFEGLDAMESALMALDIHHLDSDTINTIFRAAHSLKGGGATFGFTAIAGFTHVLETLLDQIRSGNRGMAATDVDLFLLSVDCLREMLVLNKAGETGATEKSASLKQPQQRTACRQPVKTSQKVA